MSRFPTATATSWCATAIEALRRLWRRWFPPPRPVLSLEVFRGALGILYPEDVELWRRICYRDPCVYCGRLPVGLDHIEPKSQGGRDGWQNRAPACRVCDVEKADERMVLFLLRRHAGRRTLPRPAQSKVMKARRLKAIMPPVRFTLGDRVRWR